jgi:3'(2'), 5'-bisphosphate nucleotidase
LTQTDTALLGPLLDIARAAGERIMDIYGTDFSVATKSDKSPVTDADLAAHHVILAGLQRITPDIPVLSEESSSIPFGERRHWDSYWLVDPLDGTKEFISRNGDFTVNIALIQRGAPVVGVVYIPVEHTS